MLLQYFSFCRNSSEGRYFPWLFPFLFLHHSPCYPYSLVESALQSTGLKVAVKISPSRIELWHLSQLQGLFGVLKNCTWMIKMCVQPPLIHLAVIQHPCFAAGAGHSPEEAWLKVPVVLAHQRVSEGFLNRLQSKFILYPLTHHIFSRNKVLDGG